MSLLSSSTKFETRGGRLIEVPSVPQNDGVDLIEALQDFFKNRSYRRLLFLAGFAGALFAAWHVFQKISARRREARLATEVGVAQTSIPALPAPPAEVEQVVVVEEVKPQEEVIQEFPEPGQDDQELSKASSLPVLPKEDRIVIHCSPRSFYTPCIATAPLQLETFMRVTNIPYEVSYCHENCHETPFMTYGEKVGNDFRECLQILEEKFDVDLERDVTPSRRTASHLVDISLENQFSWAILIWRWIHDEGKSIKSIQAINSLGEEVVSEVAQKVKEATRYHPIGQLDKSAFIKTVNQGIHDISAALGKHKYFQGQAPGVVDCHAFAILVQIMWNMPGSPFEYQIRKYQNLVDFVFRMKDRYWPDWNELIGKPKEYDAMNIESGTPSRSRPVSRRQSDDKLRRRKSAGSKSRTEPSSHVGVNQGSTDNEDDSSRLSDASSQSGKVGHVKIVEHMVSGKFDKRNANVK